MYEVCRVGWAVFVLLWKRREVRKSLVEQTYSPRDCDVIGGQVSVLEQGSRRLLSLL